jgi:hypothetical protein
VLTLFNFQYYTEWERLKVEFKNNLIFGVFNFFIYTAHAFGWEKHKVAQAGGFVKFWAF